MLPRSILVLLAILAAVRSHAAVIYSQPPSTSGGVYRSSWWEPEGSDYDQYVWDGFTLGTNQAITAIEWTGGFDPAYNGMGGPVVDFTVEIWSSIQGGSQPDIGSFFAPNPLVQYEVGGNAGQTPVGTLGGIAMYDYHFTLPAAFQAAAGAKYWVQIEAWQHGIPDWGLAVGTGGDGGHFRKLAESSYQHVSGDTAFRLLASEAPTVTVAASVSPGGAGEITGTGAYPIDSNVTLTAIPNAGYGFVNWTEGGTVVSTSAAYTFPATIDLTLVANFTQAYTIVTSPNPGYGGTTSGDGVFNSGTDVTVTALPNFGYTFVEWTEYGVNVSMQASYTFPVTGDRNLVAWFTTGPGAAFFDLDTGIPPLTMGQNLPFEQTAGGITASFRSDGFGGYSIQSDSSTGYHLSMFSGHYLWPNAVFRTPLVIQFSKPLTGISLVFATADFTGVETPTNLLCSAYLGSASSTPIGSSSAHGAYIGSTMPMGILVFQSASPFNLVKLEIEFCARCASSFLVDNITVLTAPLEDVDGDGIADDVEGAPPVLGMTNRYLPDSDGDGLWDGVEDANLNGIARDAGETDPRNRDTDGDRYEDGIEVLIYRSTPLDGGEPVSPFVDTDGDAMPDALDLDDANRDMDGDRVLDSYEAVCISMPAMANAGLVPPLGDVDSNATWDNADAQRILNFFGHVPGGTLFAADQSDLDRNAFIDNGDSQGSLNYFGHVIAVLPVY